MTLPRRKRSRWGHSLYLATFLKDLPRDRVAEPQLAVVLANEWTVQEFWATESVDVGSKDRSLVSTPSIRVPLRVRARPPLGGGMGAMTLRVLAWNVNSHTNAGIVHLSIGD